MGFQLPGFYAANNPYKYIDPDGRNEEKAYGLGAGIALSNHSKHDQEVWTSGEGAASTQGGSSRDGFELGKDVGERLFRRGASDTKDLLIRDSKAAENSKIAIHGVSLSTSSAPSKPGQVVRGGDKSKIEAAGFKVK